jgi:hypothetical protein
MPVKAKVLIGQRFGSVVVLGEAVGESANTRVVVVCDCGKEFETSYSYMKLALANNGRFACRSCRPQNLSTVEDPCKSRPEYVVWANMKNRCSNENYEKRHRYGGRGIKVCERWEKSFWDFLADMGERPGPDYSLDRIDNDGDYEPGNCRWATLEEQANNKSTSLMVTYLGDTKSLPNWCRELNLPYKTIVARYSKGFRGEDLFKPVKSPSPEMVLDCKGTIMRIGECAKCVGISAAVLYARYINGDRGERLFRPVDMERSRRRKRAKRHS